MSKEIVEKVKGIVRAACEEVTKELPCQWDQHFLVVLDFARKLAKKYPKADWEIIELAVYLHDFTRLYSGVDEHHLKSATEAEKMLSELGYPNDRTVRVCDCIANHRTGGSPRTIEAKILSVADALSHFRAIPYLMWLRGRRREEFPLSMEWIWKKIGGDWEKRMTLPEAKALVKKEYEAFRTLFG